MFTVLLSFVLLCVFSPTKWCKRSLTLAEAAAALDIPGTVYKNWNPTLQAAAVSQLNAPVKHSAALARCVRDFLHHFDSVGEGRNKNKRKDNNTIKDPTSSPTEEPLERVNVKKPCLHLHDLHGNDRASYKAPIPIPSWGEMALSRMHGFSSRDRLEEATVTESAVKRDDAEIPVHLWDARVLYLLDRTQNDRSSS